MATESDFHDEMESLYRGFRRIPITDSDSFRSPWSERVGALEDSTDRRGYWPAERPFPQIPVCRPSHSIRRHSAQWRQEARDQRADAVSYGLLGSGVRGRLQAIDDHEDLVHPVVCNEVDRPLSIQIAMRTEQPDSRVIRWIHQGELASQPLQTEKPGEAVRPGCGPASTPTRNRLWGGLQKLRDLSIPDATGLSDAVELSSYSCCHGSSSTSATGLEAMRRARCERSRGNGRTWLARSSRNSRRGRLLDSAILR